MYRIYSTNSYTHSITLINIETNHTKQFELLFHYNHPCFPNCSLLIYFFFIKILWINTYQSYLCNYLIIYHELLWHIKYAARNFFYYDKGYITLRNGLRWRHNKHVRVSVPGCKFTNRVNIIVSFTHFVIITSDRDET